ncbi:hypothetical protein [Actinokineospora globicatena]|uniref:Uncharacterized protein n=1 Tax=Actinokineospora globicatena TaxID=103729 RepID=A0A9W6QMC6_9PSEU|nr:hypothetical protein [Actinokineospora globicatena]GLW91207.1 hypothetical protein Aglo03_20230 [Actinokineospora globicatena]
MSHTPETIDQLRARLAGLTGPARVEPLGNLAQKLLQRATSTSLESASSRADLDEAIRHMDEAYGHLRAGDPLRPQVGAVLAYALAFRESTRGGGADRPRTTALLEESIAHGKFPTSFLALLRVLLAMALINSAQDRLTGMTSLSPIDMIAGRRSPAPAPEADRAEQLLAEVLRTPGVSKDILDMAGLLSQMCGLMKALLGLGSAPLDLSTMQGMFATFADLQGRMGSAGGSGILGMLRHGLQPGSGGILDIAPEELPVIIMEDTPTPPSTPREQRPSHADPVAVPQAPARDDMLRSLVEVLSLGRDDRGPWHAASLLLVPDAPAPDVETVDTAIAMASEVLESDGGALSEEDTALAHFLYAIALCLRQRSDAAGVEYEFESTDYELGARSLLSAVRALPVDHPAVPVVLRSLGAFLAPERPLAGLDALAAGFTGRLDSLLANGNLPADRTAELHALRCACRAAFAAAELRKAVAGLPADYPWPVSLKAAVTLLG